MKRQIDQITHALSEITTIIVNLKQILETHPHAQEAKNIINNAARREKPTAKNPAPAEAKISAETADSFFQKDAETTLIVNFTAINNALAEIITGVHHLKFASKTKTEFAKDTIDFTDNLPSKKQLWDDTKSQLKKLLFLALEKDGGADALPAYRKFSPDAKSYSDALAIGDFLNLYLCMNNARTGAPNAALEKLFQECKNLLMLTIKIFEIKPMYTSDSISAAQKDLEKLAEELEKPLIEGPLKKLIQKNSKNEKEEKQDTQKKEAGTQHPKPYRDFFVLLDNLINREYQVSAAQGETYILDEKKIIPAIARAFTTLDQTHKGSLAQSVAAFSTQNPKSPREEKSDNALTDAASHSFQGILREVKPALIIQGLEGLYGYLENFPAGNDLLNQYAILVPLALKACHPGLSDTDKELQQQKTNALLELADKCIELGHTAFGIKVLQKAHGFLDRDNPLRVEAEEKIAQQYLDFATTEELRIKAYKDWLGQRTSPQKLDYPFLVRLILQGQIQDKHLKKDFVTQFVNGACVLIFTSDPKILPQDLYEQLIDIVCSNMNLAESGLDTNNKQQLESLFKILRNNRSNLIALSKLAKIYFPDHIDRLFSNNAAVKAAAEAENKGNVASNIKAATVIYNYLAQSDLPQHALAAINELAKMGQRTSVLINSKNLQRPIFHLTQLTFTASVAAKKATEDSASENAGKFQTFAENALQQLVMTHDILATIARLYSEPPLQKDELLESIMKLHAQGFIVDKKQKLSADAKLEDHDLHVITEDSYDDLLLRLAWAHPEETTFCNAVSGLSGGTKGRATCKEQLKKLSAKNQLLTKLHEFHQKQFEFWIKTNLEHVSDESLVEQAEFTANNLTKIGLGKETIALLCQRINVKAKIPANLVLIAARVFLDGSYYDRQCTYAIVKPNFDLAQKFLLVALNDPQSFQAKEAAILLHSIYSNPDKYGQLFNFELLSVLNDFIASNGENIDQRKRIEDILNPKLPDDITKLNLLRNKILALRNNFLISVIDPIVVDYRIEGKTLTEEWNKKCEQHLQQFHELLIELDTGFPRGILSFNEDGILSSEKVKAHIHKDVFERHEIFKQKLIYSAYINSFNLENQQEVLSYVTETYDMLRNCLLLHIAYIAEFLTAADRGIFETPIKPIATSKNNSVSQDVVAHDDALKEPLLLQPPKGYGTAQNEIAEHSETPVTIAITPATHNANSEPISTKTKKTEPKYTQIQLKRVFKKSCLPLPLALAAEKCSQQISCLPFRAQGRSYIHTGFWIGVPLLALTIAFALTSISDSTLLNLDAVQIGLNTFGGLGTEAAEGAAQLTTDLQNAINTTFRQIIRYAILFGGSIFNLVMMAIMRPVIYDCIKPTWFENEYPALPEVIAPIIRENGISTVPAPAVSLPAPLAAPQSKLLIGRNVFAALRNAPGLTREEFGELGHIPLPNSISVILDGKVVQAELHPQSGHTPECFFTSTGIRRHQIKKNKVYLENEDYRKKLAYTIAYLAVTHSKLVSEPGALIPDKITTKLQQDLPKGIEADANFQRHLLNYHNADNEITKFYENHHIPNTASQDLLEFTSANNFSHDKQLSTLFNAFIRAREELFAYCGTQAVCAKFIEKYINGTGPVVFRINFPGIKQNSLPSLVDVFAEVERIQINVFAKKANNQYEKIHQAGSQNKLVRICDIHYNQESELNYDVFEKMSVTRTRAVITKTSAALPPSRTFSDDEKNAASEDGHLSDTHLSLRHGLR